ncbi:hypothetical protein D3Z39_00390 [Anaerotruncus colihominis]|uniref:Uncharacterized protein n=1 Tax=Anaerotruncus colihominis TaxID=169435 RepID=A0A845RET2_9FIRM|nr:hypothetical protein [Anaerotruncus colihominis]
MGLLVDEITEEALLSQEECGYLRFAIEKALKLMEEKTGSHSDEYMSAADEDYKLLMDSIESVLAFIKEDAESRSTGNINESDEEYESLGATVESALNLIEKRAGSHSENPASEGEVKDEITKLQENLDQLTETMGQLIDVAERLKEKITPDLAAAILEKLEQQNEDDSTIS